MEVRLCDFYRNGVCSGFDEPAVGQVCQSRSVVIGNFHGVHQAVVNYRRGYRPNGFVHIGKLYIVSIAFAAHQVVVAVAARQNGIDFESVLGHVDVVAFVGQSDIDRFALYYAVYVVADKFVVAVIDQIFRSGVFDRDRLFSDMIIYFGDHIQYRIVGSGRSYRTVDLIIAVVQRSVDVYRAGQTDSGNSRIDDIQCVTE